MSNKILFKAETDIDDIADCIERLQDAVYSKIDKDPLGAQYILTVIRKEEEE